MRIGMVSVAVVCLALLGCTPAATPSGAAAVGGTNVEAERASVAVLPAAVTLPGANAAAVAAPSAVSETSKSAKVVHTTTKAGPTALPTRSGSGKRVVYSISRQRVWLVDSNNRVLRTYLVSGKLSQPGPGTFRVYSKSRWTRSAVSNAGMQYMVRFTHGRRTGSPIGFHDIPRRSDGSYEQSISQLGKPLSAGCIRQRRADAAALWAFAPVGTKVVAVR